MIERSRQAYLSALGIDSYVPLFQLPYAPLSIAGAFVDEDYLAAEQELVLTNVIVDSASVTSVNSSPTLINDVLKELAPNNVNHKFKQLIKPKAPPEFNNSSLLAAPFNLTIYHMGQDWLAIDSREAKAALPVERLMQNIIAVCVQSPPQVLTAEVWRWPLIDNDLLANTKDDAAIALRTFLDVAFDKYVIKNVLVMGRTAYEYVIGGDGYEEKLWQSILLEQSDVKNFVVPSLVNLLRNPIDKKHLWNTLANHLSAL